jgi:hypothetical protein
MKKDFLLSLILLTAAVLIGAPSRSEPPSNEASIRNL